MADERISAGGVILPPRNEGWPMVTLQTSIPQLQFNVVCDFEDEGMEAVESLAYTLADLQQAMERDPDTGAARLRNLKLRDPHFGMPWFLMPAGLRSILSVMPGYMQVVDVEASNKLGKVVHKKRELAPQPN